MVGLEFNRSPSLHADREGKKKKKLLTRTNEPRSRDHTTGRTYRQTLIIMHCRIQKNPAYQTQTGNIKTPGEGNAARAVVRPAVSAPHVCSVCINIQRRGGAVGVRRMQSYTGLDGARSPQQKKKKEKIHLAGLPPPSTTPSLWLCFALDFQR